MQTTRGTPLSRPAGPGGRPAGEAASPARRRLGVLLAVAVSVLVLDIVSKVIVVATLTGRPPLRLLGGWLLLREDRNPGAAFSIGTSLTVVFSAIAIGVIVFILRASRRIRSAAWAVSLGLLLGGATGNLTDRLLRYPGPLRGYVVDWVQVPHWPVFNLADSAICCGGALAVLLSLRGVRIDGTRAGADGADDPDAGGGTAGPGPAGADPAAGAPAGTMAADAPAAAGAADPGPAAAPDAGPPGDPRPGPAGGAAG